MAFNTNLERMNFVIWAAKRDPLFTQSRRAYVQALWDWRKQSKTVAKTQHSFG
jgi:hypothetical protein